MKTETAENEYKAFNLDFESFVKRYGKDEAEWLDSQVRAFWSDPEAVYFDYVDNIRICRLDRADEILAYEAIEAEGCCGFNDVEFPNSPGGYTYKYGFNYGH